MSELNEVIEEVVQDAEVMTVPIDDTLTVSGEAADAKAVGDALALKQDKSEAVNIQVNGQSPDNQGKIIIDGTDIKMSSGDNTTLKAKIEAVDGKTGATIPLSAAVGAPTISEAIEEAGGKSAADIPMATGSAVTVAGKIAAMENTEASLSESLTAVAARTANDIPMSADDGTKVKAAIEARLKSVNGIPGDADGDVYVDEVPFADNLRSSLAQNTVGTFNLRTAGGSASIQDGDAWLTGIRGNRTHVGYVPESITMTVTPVEREEGEDSITATIDRDTFVAYVATSGTTTLTFTTSWSASPALYGITVTGTPKSGDVISVVYVKEERGTIYQTTPATFVATGWNLYQHSLGYAKVVKYSDVYGYCIEGTYTAVKFATTVDGTQSSITPVDGYFNVPSNGYVFVTGGSASDTEIYLTWSDWQDSAEHPEFEAYSESEIDFSTIMSTYFPYGLLRVGDIRDEIDLNVGLAISNVERLAYSAENLAVAIASGRTYECDENYIYLARATAVSSEIILDGSFAAYDHGIEYFTGTTVPVYTIILYGNNLKNKLERDVLTISAQDLTSTQQEQARDNIGAASEADLTALNSKIVTGTEAFGYSNKNSNVLGSCTIIGIKYGKLCVLNFNGIFAGSSQSGWKKMCDSDISAVETAYATFCKFTNSGCCEVKIEGSEVSVYNSPGAGNDCFGQIVFFCA